eukprot:1655239-Prymnesium_polylepis.1
MSRRSTTRWIATCTESRVLVSSFLSPSFRLSWAAGGNFMGPARCARRSLPSSPRVSRCQLSACMQQPVSCC